MKDFWETPEQKKINTKKIILTLIIVLIILSCISIIIIYNKNEFAKEWIDKNIFRKEVLQDNITTVELENEDSNVYAFNKYIGILNKNIFKIYNSTGKEENQLNIEITNPLFASTNRFLAISENKGQQIYLICDKELMWEAKVEGNISQIHVNKNGYVAVVIVDTSYKTVISMYDPKGKEMFKTYLSNTRTSDISISNDNKYLALSEIDTSGTMIQSNIKIISVEKAQTDPTNSIINTYKGENNGLIINIKYNDKDKLVCMYTDSIHLIYDGKDEILINNNDKKITFSSIKLSNNVINIEEKSSGLFTADSIISIININTKNTVTYTVHDVTKEIYTYEDTIALNLGTEVDFINTNGWLIKRYIAKQEITNMVVSNSIAGIIYRDKIEIINL